MSQPFTFQAANNRSPLRIGQIVFTTLALLAFACGSVLLSLLWFGVGMTTTGKDLGAAMEGRTFAILMGVWALVAFFMLNTSGVMFTALFILLNTGAIWLASWFLRSTSR